MVTVSFTQPIWSQLVFAAVEQRDAAGRARAKLAAIGTEPGWWVEAQAEMRAAMLSIGAAAFSVEGWGFASMQRTPGDRYTLGPKRLKDEVFTPHYQVPQPQLDALDEAITQLFVNRGDLVHHKSPNRSGKVHPILGNTPHETVQFSYEESVQACETLRLMVRACIDYPNAGNPPAQAAIDHSVVVARELGW